MDKITGQINWTPINKMEPIKIPTLNILLGVNSRLQEILMTSIIASTHHKVHVVSSGQTAIESLTQHSFDLCILSHTMPKVLATEITKQIRSSDSAWAQIPIIGLIDCTATLMIAECVCSGMNSFICAPFSAPKILSLVNYYQYKVSTGRSQDTNNISTDYS